MSASARGRRVYRALLRLLPPSFRREFGGEMEALIEERIAEAGRSGGRRLQVWSLAIVDVLAQAPGEWARAAGLGRSDGAASGDGLGRDLRVAARSLLRAPGFSALALGTLALGIGAAVAMFTVVNAVALRPLPYPDPDRLVRLSPGQNFNMAFGDAVSDLPALVARTGLSGWGLTLGSDGANAAEQISAQVVDAGYFDVFGARPALGRAFRPEEREPERSGVVILSDGLWRRRFGADPAVIGRSIALDGYDHATREVVGVMPRDFEPWRPGDDRTDVWIPLSRSSPRTIATDSTWYVNYIVGRMADDATVDDVALQVRERTRALIGQFPRILNEATYQRAGAMGLLDSMVGDVRATLLILLAAVGLVVVLACANLANLLLVRGDRRRRELAVRAALGAARARLIREQLLESLVLAGAGGAIGILLARALVAGLSVSRTAGLPRTTAIALDGRVVAFDLALSLVVALGFGLWPALRTTRADLRGDLAAGMRQRGARPGRGSGWTLVAVEIALATVLVIGAGLLLSSVRALRSVDPGFDGHDVVAVELGAPSDYEGARAVEFYDRLMQRLAALPGVRGAGAIHLTPVTRGNWSFPYLAEGMEAPEGPLPDANFRVVTPTYFDAVDQPLLRGRAFTEADRAPDAPWVGMINRTLAERLWPGEDPTGRVIKLFGSQPFTVVGVVGDVRQSALDVDPEPEMYLPHARSWGLSAMTVMVETDGDPAALVRVARAEANAIDAGVPVVSVRPLPEVVDESMAQRRFFANALAFFGMLALALGVVGVYGVVGTMMAARRGEYGVRMALGASRGRVLRGALATALAPVGVGLAAGMLAAAWGSRLLTTLLFGVQPRDPVTFAASGLVLALAAAVAVSVPALRATQVDAARVLRSD